MSCGVVCKHNSVPALLWLQCRPAATALIRHIALKFPQATGTALKCKKKSKENEKRKNRILKAWVTAEEQTGFQGKSVTLTVTQLQPLAWKLPYAKCAVLKTNRNGVSIVAQQLTNPIRKHEVAGSIPDLPQ